MPRLLRRGPKGGASGCHSKKLLRHRSAPRMRRLTMTLSADQRRALLTLYGFHPSIVAELVGRGLVSVAQEKHLKPG